MLGQTLWVLRHAKKKAKSLTNPLSIKRHLLQWKGSRDESHEPKVITGMDCHAKMFRDSQRCRKLSEFSRISALLS